MSPGPSRNDPTIADLLESLGGVPASRVLLKPLPGKATEKDLLAFHRRTGRMCELVDGVLVEKPMGFNESFLALEIAFYLQLYTTQQDLGCITGEHGTMRLMERLVRIPDVAFIRWEKFPRGELPHEPIPDLVPDLAVEVLSQSNPVGEMRRKLKEYFLAGTSLVWLVDPLLRVVTVYTAPDASQTLTEKDSLDGGSLLPGFSLSVGKLFEKLPSPARKPRRKPRGK